MEKEDKKLLTDLCARLPYGVKITIDDNIPIILNQISYNDGYVVENNECYSLEHFVIKPYLFPLSSITKLQKAELENLGWHFDNFEIHNVSEYLGTYREFVSHLDCFVLIDWLNKNHFDYRGLISKGLAIDATGLNIY